MAFAHRPQTEDETKISFVQVRLIGMRNDRRIKQGRGLDRIFSRKNKRRASSRRFAERETIRSSRPGYCRTGATTIHQDLRCRSPNSARRRSNWTSTSISLRARTRSMMPLTRSGPVGINDRFRTRLALGRKSIPAGLKFKFLISFGFR